MGKKHLNEMKEIARWCIVKKATVRDDYGVVIDHFHFGKQAWQIGEDENRLQVLFSGSDGKGKQRGWVLKQAMTNVPVKDYASLLYYNVTGKNIPISMRYKGDEDGRIKPSEIVAVKAVVGEWCLTSKGWTLFKWLKKYAGEFLDENINALASAMLLQAAKEYRIAIGKLRTGKCRDAESYGKAFGRIDEISRWFTGKQYELMFGYDGKDKLQWLNENLGVDEKWLKEKRRVYEEISAKRRCRLSNQWY